MVFFIIVGNSRIKVYKEKNIDNPDIFRHSEIQKAINTVSGKAYLASVVPTITNQLNQNISKLTIIKNDDVPIKIVTKHPENNGIDRTINSYYANKLNPECNNIIFDCGTALSVSVVNINGEELGGTISPGIKLNLKSLFSGAALLPDIDQISKSENYIGNDTLSAINNGIYWSAIGAIKELYSGISKELKQQNNAKTKATICGGWSKFISKDLSDDFIIKPNFTAKGLNYLYKEELI